MVTRRYQVDDWVRIVDGESFRGRQGFIWGIHRGWGLIFIEVEPGTLWMVLGGHGIVKARRAGKEWRAWVDFLQPAKNRKKRKMLHKVGDDKVSVR